MRSVCITAALSIALTTLAPSAAAAEEPPERFSMAFETAGLAYGLAVGSPRIPSRPRRRFAGNGRSRSHPRQRGEAMQGQAA